MSGLQPSAAFPDAPSSTIEDTISVIQTVPPSSDGSSYATTQATAAAGEPSALDGRPSSTATQAVLNPSGEVTPGLGEPTSSAAHSTNVFDSAPPEDIVTYGRISFEEYLSLSEITFEWGDSYDSKDWKRLKAILAPILLIDYRDVNGYLWPAMPRDDFVHIMSHAGFVCDPLVRTHHHIGVSKWQKIREDHVIGHHQLTAAHQRYSAIDRKRVESRGHSHALIKHLYTKIGGEWKLAGLKPTVRWNDMNFQRAFRRI